MNQKQVGEQKEDLNYMESSEVDFDSFQEAKRVAERYKADVGRIIGCDVVSSEEAKSETDDYSYVNSSFDTYLKLIINKNDAEIPVFVPLLGDEKTEDLKFIYKWTTADSIDNLAGKYIPIKYDSYSDSYKLEKFNDSGYKYLPLPVIKKLINLDIISKELNEQWHKPKWVSFVVYIVSYVAIVLSSAIIIELSTVLIGLLWAYMIVANASKYLALR